MEARLSMERRMPISGEFYRHFKGKIYQIKLIAKDSETGELQIVYQGMYPPFQCWVRPLDNFMDRVDVQKYPNAEQKMRFVHISADELASIDGMVAVDHISVAAEVADNIRRTGINEMAESTGIAGASGDAGSADMSGTGQMDDATLVRALQSGRPEKYLSGHMTHREIAERGCMKILDAETYREKRQLMIGMKPYLDKRLLHNIAAALDIVLEEGDLDSQYDSLLHCLDTMEHFEGGRLR